MSDTPRTDAAMEWARIVEQWDTSSPHELMVAVDWVKGLERELNGARAEIGRLHELAALGAEAATDAQRLRDGLGKVRDLVTANHETKESFIKRVRAALAEHEERRPEGARR